MPFALDVECWTLNCQLANPFGVERFLSPFGRVAESGLRHSTRNRAWGNPPWVRIPPLPPANSFDAEEWPPYLRRHESISSGVFFLRSRGAARLEHVAWI